MVGVVLIHSAPKENIKAMCEADISHYRLFEDIFTWFSYILPSVSVPLFFLFAGYLFFQNFDPMQLVPKLGRRVRTLLVPYLLWNLIAIIIAWIAWRVTGKNFASSVDFSSFGIREFMLSFWNLAQGKYPIDIPLWFLRSLIVIMAFTPVIYLVVKYLRVFSLLLFFILSYLLLPCVPGADWGNVFYFSIGAYFAMHAPVLLTTLIPYWGLSAMVWLGMSLIALFFPDSGWYRAAMTLTTMSGIFTLITMTAWLQSKREIRMSKLLCESAFFLYAFHGLIIGLILTTVFGIVPRSSNFLLILAYFLTPIITIAITLAVYKAAKKLTPGLLSLLTGGRS